MGQRERERDRIQVWERKTERGKDGKETERQEFLRERIQMRERDRSKRKGERQGWERER